MSHFRSHFCTSGTVNSKPAPAACSRARPPFAVTMVGKEQFNIWQKSVTKFMMSMPVALAVVALACLSMVQFQQQIQVYLHQYLPLVAVVFAVFIGVQNYQYKQLFKELIESVGKIEVTSQVVATRANMTEWRSCLQFNAEWGQYSLQTAYRMWQLGLLRSPPPPANTVNGNGMQLSTYDAVIADTQCPQYMQTFHTYDYYFSVLKEKLTVQTHRQSANQWERQSVQHLNPFPAAVIREMNQYTQLLREWETDVQSGRFRVGTDVSTTDITVSLMEFRDRANQFTSTAFTTLFS